MTEPQLHPGQVEGLLWHKIGKVPDENGKNRQWKADMEKHSAMRELCATAGLSLGVITKIVASLSAHFGRGTERTIVIPTGSWGWVPRKKTTSLHVEVFTIIGREGTRNG